MLNARTLITKLMLLALVLCALPTLAEDAAVNLRPQWEVGQTARYEFWTRSEKEESTQFQGQTQSGTTVYENVGELSWSVTEVREDGSSVCAMSLTRMKVTMTPPEGEAMVFDSDNPTGEVPLFDTLLSAMVDEPLVVHVNADGSIERVEGIDAMKAAAGEDAAESIPEEAEFIETASELATLIAAPAAARVGDNWTAQNTWPQEDVLTGLETSADVRTTFTLEQIGQVEGVHVASIRSRSDLDLEFDLSTLPEGAPDIDLQVGETQARGELLYDLNRHETIARNDMQRYQVNITITLALPNQPAQSITASITQTTRSQVLRIAEESQE